MRAGARSSLARKQHANFYGGTEAPSARYAEDGATPAAESRYQEALPTNGFYKSMRTSDYSAAGDDAAGGEHVAPTDDYQREYKGPSAASPPTWNPPTHPPKPPEPPFSCVAWLFPWAGDAPMEHTPADEEPPPAPEEPRETVVPMHANGSAGPADIAKVEAARIKYQSRQKSPKAITPPSVPPLLTSQRTVPLDSHRHGASSVRSQSQSGDPHRNGGGRTDRTNVTAQLLELEVRRQSSLP